MRAIAQTEVPLFETFTADFEVPAAKVKTARIHFVTAATECCPALVDEVNGGERSIVEARAWWAAWGLRRHAVEIDIREGVEVGAFTAWEVPGDTSDFESNVCRLEAFIDGQGLPLAA